MASEEDWDGTALFSPSKARVQQAQAKDWAVVDSWLTKRYSSKRLPAFERNEETLRALLSLANANESADEQRGYIDRIDKLALSAATKRVTADDRLCLLILSEPSKPIAADVLVETSLNLGCPTTDAPAMAAAICDITNTAFLLDQEMQRVKTQIELMETERNRLQQNIKELKDDVFGSWHDAADRTQEWLRDSKHMRAKIHEYDERLTTNNGARSGDARVELISQLKKGLAADHTLLDKMSVQLETFQSLPTDTKAAQAKMDTAKKELLVLMNSRDQMFEQLANSG